MPSSAEYLASGGVLLQPPLYDRAYYGVDGLRRASAGAETVRIGAAQAIGKRGGELNERLKAGVRVDGLFEEPALDGDAGPEETLRQTETEEGRWLLDGHPERTLAGTALSKDDDPIRLDGGRPMGLSPRSPARFVDDLHEGGLGSGDRHACPDWCR
jgi:hypothetical protein